MFECLSAALILLSFGGTSALDLNPPVSIVAYCSTPDGTETSMDKEYFSSLGNNIPNMDNSVSYRWDANILLLYSNFLAQVKNTNIDSEEFNSVVHFLSALRKDQNKYSAFLKCATVRLDNTVCAALSIFFSQIDYDFIYPIEENFVFYALEHGDICIQETALDILLAWDNFSDFEKLKEIKINNRYLQEDLSSFIIQKA